MHRFFVDPDIASAKTLHTDFYSDPFLSQVMKQKVFATTWQFITDSNSINDAGSCYPFTLLENYLDEPLLLTRDKQNKLHCLSNVCTHRGNVLINEQCKTSNIRCKYHGRIFQLDGSFHSMPEFKEVKNFPSADDDLQHLPLHQWSNLLFTSLQPLYAADIFLKDMASRLSWLPVNEFVYRPDLSKEFSVDAHWALYCENYLEGFHIPFVHAGLNAVIDYGNYSTELFRYSNLQLGIAKDNEDCFDIPETSPDHGKNIAAYYFWVFPNMMFNFYPWGLSINIVEPQSIDKTKVCFLTYMWDESKYNFGAGSNLDKVEMEDEAIVQNVQKGIRSRFYQHGRYSVTREQGTHHFHRLICEFMNT
ncbi:MAG TPA: aromatic ring-hydroxylating dioxygenase subunit alpha [Chitinophagaceae bacterium]|nr:aromatic ring-hydroxylating dioxygenase subunit alpha [Chitinophagaceae bacterium]